MLEHGGHLISAAEHYNIPLEQWVDLSTGINPNGWPIPKIPLQYWQRLPEANDGLVLAAKTYYQCHSILPIAGSQAAIQALPLLRKKSIIGILPLAYEEHGYSWEKAGHTVIKLTNEQIDSQLDTLDVLIIINPNNPTAQQFDKETLLSWQQQLAKRGGWLIIDEAFIDTTPSKTLSNHPPTNGLIILRSIGKFFGLAGIRCGFILGTPQLLSQLNEILGPWAVSNPSRYIATRALLDTQWQQKTRQSLKQQSTRLAKILIKNGLTPNGKTDLFLWVKMPEAENIHQNLAKQGVLTRLFKQPPSLRFGLPKDEDEWLKLRSIVWK